MKDDKTCVICGKSYKYCESCPSKYNTSETWRNVFCSENCRKLYHICDQFKAGQISEKSANKELKALDISYISALNEPMKSIVLLVINDEEKKSKSKQVANDIETPIEVSKKAKSKSRVKRKDNEVG